ncbi:pentatricopeptide repeat-containing protein At4g02750-like [Selaginella moellendorffii]|nr:pentatricopeptide repeat-containing protein At4g02750-like [Selaginella moellendorffii]|eukprot:XP_024536105.1 pentatricopeptide repeat-containing protein At4g02750-like [Selaginella moellendorffii]
MPMWDAVSWNSLMWGLAEDGQIEEAWKMIHAMPVPDIVSWTVIIQALADAGDVPRAREIFDAMIQRNGVTWQLLVSGYAQLGHTNDAKFLFGRMPQHSLVSWNSMLACYSQSGNLGESKKTFDGMRIKDVASWTSIMTAYARCGHLADAERIFTEMPKKDVVAWNALAVAYNDMEMFERCDECYKKMPHWNLVSLNGYLHMICIENAKQAKEFFDSMPRKNSISWNNILAASLRHHKLTDTKAVFDRSPKHTPVALSTMLQALVLEGDHSSFDQAELLYREIPNKEQDLFASSLMIAGYAQRGELDKSRRVFDSMEAWDFVSWTAIIQAHAHNAQIDPALELLRLMCLDGSSSPNEVTLLAILNGFAHCGLAEECCAFFLSIEPDFGIHPTLDHYCCVADLLGRARRLDEAEELVATMPFLPDAIAWATLLGACRIHGDAARGARIYGRVMDLDPTHAPSLLLASRIAADE